MNISPINSTNFQGNFQKTATLEKIMNNANRDSLGKFNEIIKRAARVNDGLLFKFEEFPSTCKRKTYILRKLDLIKDFSSIITGITTKINDTIGNGTKESEVLEKFIPTLEDFYPKKYTDSKENIMDEIKTILVN